MHSKECTICLNLNDSALSQRYWSKCQIHYYALRKSAEECAYCKIIFDGIMVSGFDERAKSFMFSNNDTFCLTPNSLLASSWVESKLEYYISAAKSEAHDLNSHRGKDSNDAMSRPSAIKVRPAIA